jgi:predicted DNA-binding transcriptional regulator AlpA
MTLLLLQREAASVLRLSERTLERLGPKFIRCGGRAVRYRQSDLDAWLTARSVHSTSEINEVGVVR